MDVKDLVEANEAIAMLKELDLPISIEQLGKRKMLETEYLKENVIPQIQSQIQSLVEHLHKSFCFVVNYEYGAPVEVRLVENAKIKDVIKGSDKTNSTRSRGINAYTSERIQAEWNTFIESLPAGKPYYRYTLTQSYSSLSKLLRIIQSEDMLTFTKPLLEALEMPTTGMMTPKNLVDMLEPEQFVNEKTNEGTIKKIVLWSQSQKVVSLEDGTRKKIFMSDGVTPVMIRKTKIIKEGQWSLKLLCDLMAQKEYFANLHSR